MKSFVDLMMTNIPIFFILLVFICLIYSEFSGICISWDNIGSILSGVIVGDSVKVLG